MGALVGLLLIGAVILHFIDRWRKREAARGESSRETTLDLTSFRQMYEDGEITQSEYERIRNKIAAKMKREVGITGTGLNGELVTPVDLQNEAETQQSEESNPEDPPPADAR